MNDGEDETECGQPCDPNNACDGCSEYWQRMEREDYWNRALHRWTDKGWAQITRSW